MAMRATVCLRVIKTGMFLRFAQALGPGLHRLLGRDGERAVEGPRLDPVRDSARQETVQQLTRIGRGRVSLTAPPMGSKVLDLVAIVGRLFRCDRSLRTVRSTRHSLRNL